MMRICVNVNEKVSHKQNSDDPPHRYLPPFADSITECASQRKDTAITDPAC